MSTKVRPAPTAWRGRTAAAVSEVLAPIVVIPLVVVIVGVHSASSMRSAAVDIVVALLFSAVVPYGALMLAQRSGRVSDRHVRLRHQRPFVMTVALASVTFGLLLLALMQAPGELTALVLAMVIGMASTLTISLWWKVSMHTSCVAGVVATLAMLTDPWLWGALIPVCAVVGWSRVTERHHSLWQVVAGSLVGTAAAVVVLSLANAAA